MKNNGKFEYTDEKRKVARYNLIKMDWFFTEYDIADSRRIGDWLSGIGIVGK